MPLEENKNYSFSIVIPCRNEKNYIKNCINSILEQNYNQSLIEIIIVDGLSDDGTREIINNFQKSYSSIKLFDNPEKKTPQALNIGIRNSSMEIVVILGAHAELDPDFIFYNNKYQVEKNVKVTGGTQVNVGRTRTQKLIGFVMQLPFGMATAKYRWSNKEQFVDTVVYAAYRRELFDELGFFEEKFTISEDAEFNWRVRQAGYKIFYSPQIVSRYYPRETISSFIKQIFRYGILRVNVLKKHFDSIKLAHLVPPLFVFMIVILTALSLFSSFSSIWLTSLLVIYLILNLFLTIPNTKSKGIVYYFLVPVLIFIMHISWGSGFILGLILPKSKDL